MKTTNLKNGDELKNEDDLKNEDSLKNEDDLKSEEDLKMKTTSKMKHQVWEHTLSVFAAIFALLANIWTSDVKVMKHFNDYDICWKTSVGFVKFSFSSEPVSLAEKSG